MDQVTPSIDLVSFTCPRCSARAHQTWLEARAKRLDRNAVPDVVGVDVIDTLLAKPRIADDEDFHKTLLILKESQMALGDYEHAHCCSVLNLSISQCYACDQLSLWVAGTLVFPVPTSAPHANADMPSDIKRDYDEAGRIFAASPRGAAALLRLAIQKLVVQAGGSGANLNEDIALLVRGGLPEKVQKSLDVVRVIGNNAVHPGLMDVEDNPTVVTALFGLVNAIVTSQISEQARAEEAYALLPEGDRAKIEKRDKRGGGKK